MPSVFAYVRLYEAGGSNACTVKMAPKWTVFLIFPRKVIYLPRANAPISLVCLVRGVEGRIFMFQMIDTEIP